MVISSDEKFNETIPHELAFHITKPEKMDGYKS